MNLLEKLYYGELIPFEHPALDQDKWHSLVSQVVEAETALLDGMTEEQKEKYQKYYEAASRHHACETRDFFIIGFRLGARMMLEILDKDTPSHNPV